MACQSVRLALFVGAIAAVAASSARAADVCSTPCAPATRTVTVTECVPETYTTKKTVYKVECVQEEYDAVKCVNETQQMTKEVVCVKRVPVMTTEKRKVCKTITTFEEKCVMKPCWKTVEVTCMKKKLVRLGHWECKEKECALGNLFHKCARSCDPCDPCANDCAPKTRTVKRWVCCPEYQECPVTKCKKVCEQVPTMVKVPVCKQVWTEEDVQVCRYNCVEEKKTVNYTVCVPKQVTYKATRTVRKCVPTEVDVTCTRMVPRTVTREVPVTSCSSPCNDDCCERGRLFGRLRGHGDCCR